MRTPTFAPSQQKTTPRSSAARTWQQPLGYARPAKAVLDHCKGVPFWEPLETAGGIQQTRFITEGDVYRLIFSSKLPTAEKFEAWVVDEVLPSIRKH